MSDNGDELKRLTRAFRTARVKSEIEALLGRESAMDIIARMRIYERLIEDPENYSVEDALRLISECPRFWDRGFETAKSWYHEEWDGSYIQLTLARDIAKAIESYALDEAEAGSSSVDVVLHRSTALDDALSNRTYTLNEAHLTGFRLCIGFNTQAEADAAQIAIGNLQKGK
jgi:hypothetical protein